MVQALNEMGLRVVMDVVYNHTNAAGQSPSRSWTASCPATTIA
jgi:pullulanase/glycogen debranching enzyme